MIPQGGSIQIMNFSKAKEKRMPSVINTEKELTN